MVAWRRSDLSDMGGGLAHARGPASAGKPAAGLSIRQCGMGGRSGTVEPAPWPNYPFSADSSVSPGWPGVAYGSGTLLDRGTKCVKGCCSLTRLARVADRAHPAHRRGGAAHRLEPAGQARRREADLRMVGDGGRDGLLRAAAGLQRAAAGRDLAICAG